jgi:predicted transcriptional regulator
VDDYGRIRRAHRDEMSIREIAKQFHHSRQKVRQILRGESEPRPYANNRSLNSSSLLLTLRIALCNASGPTEVWRSSATETFAASSARAAG